MSASRMVAPPVADTRVASSVWRLETPAVHPAQLEVTAAPAATEKKFMFERVIFDPDNIAPSPELYEEKFEIDEWFRFPAILIGCPDPEQVALEIEILENGREESPLPWMHAPLIALNVRLVSAMSVTRPDPALVVKSIPEDVPFMATLATVIKFRFCASPACKTR